MLVELHHVALAVRDEHVEETGHVLHGRRRHVVLVILVTQKKQ